eukprot:199713-Chlamydomonas_euryale.AAC.1
MSGLPRSVARSSTRPLTTPMRTRSPRNMQSPAAAPPHGCITVADEMCSAEPRSPTGCAMCVAEFSALPPPTPPTPKPPTTTAAASSIAAGSDGRVALPPRVMPLAGAGGDTRSPTQPPLPRTLDHDPSDASCGGGTCASAGDGICMLPSSAAGHERPPWLADAPRNSMLTV